MPMRQPLLRLLFTGVALSLFAFTEARAQPTKARVTVGAASWAKLATGDARAAAEAAKPAVLRKSRRGSRAGTGIFVIS